jgi:hypothetical protein
VQVGQTATGFSERRSGQDLCARCGIPVDSKYFDDSSVTELPLSGREVVLAQFELPPQYCGVLEYFAQFTNLLASNPGEIETYGLEWALLSNGRPLAPYLPFDRILNPWGYSSFQLSLRLDASSTTELVVRNRAYTPAAGKAAIDRVGGRIVGRYWYDAAYGDVGRGRY